MACSGAAAAQGPTKLNRLGESAGNGKHASMHRTRQKQALRAMWMAWLALLVVGCASPGRGRIAKVLPHWLDHQGRHALAPSLFERDAYQHRLRTHPEARGGLCYDVHWFADAKGGPCVLQLELRTTARPLDEPLVLRCQASPRSVLGRWTRLTVAEADFRTMGEPLAWRVTLWRGGELLDEERSFLW